MQNTLYLPELREMLANEDTEGLSEFCTTLHPARTADYMDALSPEETWEVLKHADIETRVSIFSYTPHEKQIAMLETLNRQEMGRFIGDLPPDERVDLLDDLEPEVVKELLPLVPAEERRDIFRLGSYPEKTAGRVMTTEFARLSENMTIRGVREQLKAWGESRDTLETIYYLYVVDDEDHLRGVVSFRELAFASLIFEDNEKQVGDLMQRNVISVPVDQDQEELAQIFADHDLLAIPVVDRQNRLVGIVTHDDVIDVVRDEATEDAQMLGGVAPLDEGYLQADILSLTWKRGIWLMILFLGALFTATALSGYESFTAQHVWLVIFIPLVISSGGNSGNQAATLVITALNLQEIDVNDWKQIIYREILMGLLLGAGLATIGLGVSLMLAFFNQVPNDHWINLLVVPATLLFVVLGGTITGSTLPLIFTRLGLDPALMSNPFVAGVMDILGIVIYMTVAGFLLAFK